MNFHKKSLNGKFDNKKEKRNIPFAVTDRSLCFENLKTRYLLIMNLKSTFDIPGNTSTSLNELL